MKESSGGQAGGVGWGSVGGGWRGGAGQEWGGEVDGQVNVGYR
jgi:hypothetical protein